MSFNRAPTQTIAAFTPDGGFAMRWGLVPSWSKEPTTKYSTFNAVLETVAEKPVYRSAWKESRRCLIPVAGYYEWQVEEGTKQPYYITSMGGEPLFLGGIWEPWSIHDEALLSCSILTRKPVQEVEHLHSRMPVVIPPDLIPLWLSSAPEEARNLAQSATPELEYYPVSRYVSNARNGGSQCIEASQ